MVTKSLNGRKIKEIIRSRILLVFHKHSLTVDKIILFGSQARGDADKYSDWDVLVIVGEDIDSNQRRRLFDETVRELARYHIPCDLLIRSRREVNEFKDYVHSVTKTAIKEGMVIWGG